MKINSDELENLIDSLKISKGIRCNDSFSDNVIKGFAGRKAMMRSIKLAVSLVVIIIFLNIFTYFYMNDLYKLRTSERAYYIESVKNVYNNNIYDQYLTSSHRKN